MSKLPDLPLITLENGAHFVDVIDPRPAPLLLGMRYTHGGYLAHWFHGDRLLTGSPAPEWHPMRGAGLPDIFERGLGVCAAREGEAFLRIGCGQLIREGRSWTQNQGEATPVEWRVVEQSSDYLVMACEDSVEIEGSVFAYEFERTVRVVESGPVVSSQLRLDVPWAEPLVWFAHPFFSHQDGTGTRMALPDGADTDLAIHDGRIVLSEEGGFGVATGVHGLREPLDLALDLRCGGGSVQIASDWPLDKLVVYASPYVFSVEPYLARAAHTGENFSWSIEYQYRS